MKTLPANFLQMDQGSAEWLQARCGCVTASRVKDVVTKLKNGKESAARQTYKMELLAEILTGSVREHYVSAAMDFGSEN
jgi:exodeoxyribonuclease (lambda-induced)